MLISFSYSPANPSPPQNSHPTPSKFTETPSPMDSSDHRPSPRQLQGPRPAPLKVRKNSYKINKKPPTVPNNSNHPPPQPPRQPIIIYTVSPKIIHTNPSDFMNLVQRLTGPNSGDPPPAGDHAIRSPSAALSPAARFAAIEKADKSSPRSNNIYKAAAGSSNDHVIDIEDNNGLLLDRTNPIPGILSPLPSSLQPISSSFFSPIANFDPGSLSFLNDLSPFGAASGNTFLTSPNNFNNLLSTPTITSPGAYWDLFNDF